MEENLGSVLKELRKKKNLTAKNVSDRLKDMGYSISDKTLSGYETGIRMPNANVFMALCQIYDCRNILEMFSFVKAEYSIPTDDEWAMIEDYRLLDKIGKERIDYELKKERERVREIEELKNKLDTEFSSEIVPYPYLGKIACAGTGFYFDDIPTEIIKAPYAEGADFIIGVSGESMEPDYYDGERLYVKKTKYLKKGDVGIFTINNQCYLKELGDNGLISKNEKYNDILGSEDVRLIGKVIDKVKEY